LINKQTDRQTNNGENSIPSPKVVEVMNRIMEEGNKYTELVSCRARFSEIMRSPTVTASFIRYDVRRDKSL